MEGISKINEKGESSPLVDLLNQTCLDLVAEINKLKFENHRLRKKVRAARKAHRKKIRVPEKESLTPSGSGRR